MFILNSDFSYITAFVVGFLGSIHCIGMCGSIVIILSASLPKNKNIYIYQLFYNFGRIISYSIIGFFAGFLGFLFSDLLGSKSFLVFKLIGGLSLLSVGFYFSGLLHVRYFFEGFGWSIWSYFHPYIKKFMPIQHYWQAIFVGLIWGNIPCGLVYSVLIWSISFGSFLKSSILMLVFGFGTLPSMMITGYFALSLKKSINNKIVRFFVSLLIIFFGLLTIITAVLSDKCH